MDFKSDFFVNSNKCTMKYSKDDFSYNFLLIDRNSCDALYPEFLEIELNPNIDKQNFKNICHKICLEIKIGIYTILNIPFKFLLLLNYYEECDNKFYIDLSFKMFYDNIKLNCLSFHGVSFKLTNAFDIFLSCNLLSKNINYNKLINDKIINKAHEEIFQFITSTEINCFDKSNTFNYIMNAEGYHKGFFLECENVNKINEIQLIINNKNILNYNKFLIKKKCVKINENLLYLPFNFNQSYEDRSSKSFEGSINLSNYSTKLIVKLDDEISKLCIYNLSSNLLRTYYGCCGLAYDYAYKGHYYEEFNKDGIYKSNKQRYIQHYETLKKPFEKYVGNKNKIVKYKKITDNKKMTCAITLTYIEPNNKYINCIQCNNNFKEIWLMQSEFKKKCPICMTNITNFDVFINNDEDELYFNKDLTEKNNKKLKSDKYFIKKIGEKMNFQE
jgi:hypothetical protein